MDIRDKERVGHEDVMGLNFISSGCPYIFRLHYNQGLRSHVMEVLKKEEYEKEKEGILENNIRTYPKAEPNNVLRIYRTRVSLDGAMEDIKKTNEVRKYLKENIAYSSEFVASYKEDESYGTILCGLQDYIKGKAIDPWFCVPESYDENFKPELNKFIERIKECAYEKGLIPDLAGKGNLIYSSKGVVLTDINNINEIDYSPEIYIDNKGFPIIDTSVEALSNLEKAVNGSLSDEKLYNHFLEAGRKSRALKIRKEWMKEDDMPFLGAQ